MSGRAGVTVKATGGAGTSLMAEVTARWLCRLNPDRRVKPGPLVMSECRVNGEYNKGEKFAETVGTYCPDITKYIAVDLDRKLVKSRH
jgi:hypothetical protein